MKDTITLKGLYIDTDEAFRMAMNQENIKDIPKMLAVSPKGSDGFFWLFKDARDAEIASRYINENLPGYKFDEKIYDVVVEKKFMKDIL